MRGSPKHVRHLALEDVETGQTQVAGRIVERGYSCSLDETVWVQIDRLKRAKIHQGHLLVSTDEALSLSFRHYGTQVTFEEELRAHVPHQTVPLQAEVCLATGFALLG